MTCIHKTFLHAYMHYENYMQMVHVHMNPMTIVLFTIIDKNFLVNKITMYRSIKIVKHANLLTRSVKFIDNGDDKNHNEHAHLKLRLQKIKNGSGDKPSYPTTVDA